LTLILDGEYRLAFNDTRKFGRVWLLDDPAPLFAKLGPEPFADEFTPEWLYTALQKKNRARLHPLTPSGSVSISQAARLQESVREVLQDGIQHNGSSIDWVYRGGGFQNYFRVYDRAGEACYTCQTPIERMVVGQRGTHFCPHCQVVS
jgi:formamidopyrimidine-DNA glycosylase